MSQTYAGGESQSALNTSKQETAPGLRRFLLVVLVLGIIGTGTDLFLLEHFEERLQFIPLILLALALVVVLWHVIHRGRASVRALQVLMIFFVIGGLVGLVLHYRGSMEFQLEVNPDLTGLELFLKAIRAKAPPALGPAAMIHLGLVGLAYGYRYPVAGKSPGHTITRRVT
ncbi:MAG: hypothetical protein WAV20_14365 [Blastocatellia bacterium]